MGSSAVLLTLRYSASGILGFVLQSHNLLVPCSNRILCLHTLAVCLGVMMLIAGLPRLGCGNPTAFICFFVFVIRIRRRKKPVCLMAAH